MGSSYIYIITDPANNCYVGQSTNVKVKTGRSLPYNRLYQHVANAYYERDSGDDASVVMFENWPLQWLNMKVYEENDNGIYGIPEEVYYKFLEYFSPEGKEKIQSESKGKKNKGEISAIKLARDGTISGTISKEQNRPELRMGTAIDIAEILWMSRYQAAGYNVLNKVIGGQRASWVFLGDKNAPLNINTTPPSRITSLLWSTEATQDQQKAMTDMQNELDKLFDKYLDSNMADLIVDQITRTSTSRKNLFNPKVGNVKELPLKPILEESIFKVLSDKGGGKGGQTAEFKKEFDAILEKYSALGLEKFGLNTQMKKVSGGSLIENVSQKIAASLLQQFQGRKMTGTFTVGSITFNIVNGKIKYKGKNGANIGDSNTETISVSLRQSLNFNSYDKNKSSWWYSAPDMHGHHLSDSVRWAWAKNIFHYIFLKVRDKSLGILAQAESGDFSDSIGHTSSGDVIVVGNEVEDSLSGKMQWYYLHQLGYKNAIFKDWRGYFGRLYATCSRKQQQWNILSSRDGGNVYAILDGVMVDGEDGDSFMVGLSLEQADSFDIDTSDNYDGILF